MQTPTCAISSDLSNVKFIGEVNVNTENGRICVEALFPIGSTWKDMTLLFDTVKTYSARTGWKYFLKQLHKIRCSCYKTSNLNRNMSQGFINKSCTWMINMKSSKYSNAIRGSTHRNGKIKSVPLFEENVSVTITKNACLEHCGSFSP